MVMNTAHATSRVLSMSSSVCARLIMATYSAVADQAWVLGRPRVEANVEPSVSSRGFLSFLLLCRCMSRRGANQYELLL